MMKKQLAYTLLTFLYLNLVIVAQAQVTSPEEYLGYELGSEFTPHYKVVGYLEEISNQSSKALLKKYGETYEGRSLNILFVSSEENIKNLESIRTNNLRKAGLLTGEPEEDGKIIVWLSYNVHGDEASSTEAAIATAFKLVEGNDDKISSWLENTVVAIDPCVNPDGRDRYVHWYKENKSNILIIDPLGAGHTQSWPGGRMNHYLFDLNRDWSWLSQIESKYRIALYNNWLPQIHVDYHEQGYNSPYYFAPAAAPYHALITDWQREFQVEIGKNHARYFDANGWLYFTKERFDLFYPGYGDTYPTFNGAIGMTYELAGSGRAGLGIKTNTGDTLTLKDRILHHYTSGISTIEISSINAQHLEKHFIEFYRNGSAQVSGAYHSFVVKHDIENEKIRKLIDLLDQHKVRYGQLSSSKVVKGFDFYKNRNVTVTIDPSDLVIPVQQAKSILVRVLFEPVSSLADSLTYDITSWSIPFAYGLQTFAVTQELKLDMEGYTGDPLNEIDEHKMPYSYAFSRNDVTDVRILSELMLKGLNVRTNYESLTSDSKRFLAGSFFVLIGDNRNFDSNIPRTISEISKQYKVDFNVINTGLSVEGPDLGSSKLKIINNKINVGVLYGENIRPYNVGEVWHLFEQELKYPLIRINTSYFEMIDWNELDVVIFPEGEYRYIIDEDQLKNLKNWVEFIKQGLITAIPLLSVILNIILP
jgi:hypothetical protein